jgi:hypothetical protein
MQKRTVSASTALLLGTLLGAPPLLADDVYLKNGRSFENVVAEIGDTQVRVHMPGGVISLPRGSVDRVTKADSSFAEYSRRKQELESRDRGAGHAGGGRDADSAGRRAGDWLELARWARSNNLPQGTREAALAAAEINPREPGLAGLLRGFGYVYEASVDRWIPYDDAMRLHGYVQDGGTWISREEHADKVRARAEARAQAALVAREEAAAARDLVAAEMMQAQLGLAQQGAYDNGYGAGQYLGGFYGGLGSLYWPYGTSSVFGVPGFGVRRGSAERGEHRRGESHHERGSFRAPRFSTSVFGVPQTGHTGFQPPAAAARAVPAPRAQGSAGSTASAGSPGSPGSPGSQHSSSSPAFVHH